MRRLLILCVLLFGLGVHAHSTRVIVPLEQRIAEADLIVIGRLADVVPNRLSITYHKYWMGPEEIEGFGERDFEFYYNSGSIVIDRILKGTFEQESVPFASYRGAEVNGNPSIVSGLEDLSFKEGDHGIWLMHKSDVIVFGFYGVNDPDNLVPIDSLESVERIIERLTDGGNAPSR